MELAGAAGFLFSKQKQFELRSGFAHCVGKALARDARVPAVLQRLDWTGEAQHHRENKKQDYLVLVDAHPIDLSVKPYDLLF